MEKDWRQFDEQVFRCAVVLDTSYEGKGRLLGAMAHGLMGLAAEPFVQENGVIVRYTDQSSILSGIGFHYACLVLAARSQTEIQGVSERARKKAVPRSEVVEDMMIGTSLEQYEAVRGKPADQHRILAVAMFGDTKTLKSVAGSLPLYR